MTGASVIIALSQVPYLDPTYTPLHCQASHAQGVLHVFANCGFLLRFTYSLRTFVDLFIYHLGMTATCVLCLT